MTNTSSKEALNWLRFILNRETERPSVTNWLSLLNIVDRQKIVGVCMPDDIPENIDKDLYFRWMAVTQSIERQNQLMNERVGHFFGILEQEGFECCLLKGQGNAAMYSNPLRRNPGDIDVWVDSSVSDVIRFVNRFYPDAIVKTKHIQIPSFHEVAVDIHITPLKLYNPLFQKRLQNWIKSQKKSQFNNKILIQGVEKPINVPTAKFNAVFQMGHMLVHLFERGLGMRQVIDYYYVLCNLDLSEKERKELKKLLKRLGLFRFARAIMWIECSVLGLPDEKCLFEPDEKNGIAILNDILKGGNFGIFNISTEEKKSFFYRGKQKTLHMLVFIQIAPCEGIARLCFNVMKGLFHVVKLICGKTEKS